MKKTHFWLALLVSGAMLASCSRGNDQGSGKKDDKDTAALNGRIVATFTPESKNAFQYNPPTIVGDFIYIGTSTKIDLGAKPEEVLTALPASFFYKMDLNLKTAWKYPLGQAMAGGGASLDSQGNIYFTTLDFSVNPVSDSPGKNGFLTVVSLCSLTPEGQLRWKKQISVPGEGWLHAMLNCAVGADDTIYIGDSKLFAFNPDGSVKWQYPQDNRIISGMRSSPIIDGNGNVYFVSPEPVDGSFETDAIRAYKFSPGGDLAWSVLLGNNILDPEGGGQGGGGKERWLLSTPAFSSGETSIYAAVGNTINRVDTATGQILWSFKPEGATGSFKASPAVDALDNIYLGTKSNTESTLYAISAWGTVIWKRMIGADMYPSPLLGDDGRLYFGSEGLPDNSTHFHAVDMATGATVWDTGAGKSPMPDISFSSPALYKGFIYVGSFQVRPQEQSEALFKIKVDAQKYLAGAAWPRFHGGNANNGRSGN